MSIGKKNRQLKKKCRLENIHLPLQKMSGHSLECKTEKRKRRGKPPRAQRGKKKEVCHLEKKKVFCRLGEKMLVGKK